MIAGQSMPIERSALPSTNAVGLHRFILYIDSALRKKFRLGDYETICEVGLLVDPVRPHYVDLPCVISTHTVAQTRIFSTTTFCKCIPSLSINSIVMNRTMTNLGMSVYVKLFLSPLNRRPPAVLVAIAMSLVTTRQEDSISSLLALQPLRCVMVVGEAYR